MKKFILCVICCSLLASIFAACGNTADRGNITEPTVAENDISLNTTNAVDIANSNTDYPVVDVTADYLSLGDENLGNLYGETRMMQLDPMNAELPREESMTAQEAANLAAVLGSAISGQDAGKHEMVALCGRFDNYQAGKRQVWQVLFQAPEPYVGNDDLRDALREEGLPEEDLDSIAGNEDSYLFGRVFVDAISGELLLYAHGQVWEDRGAITLPEAQTLTANIFAGLGLGAVTNIDLDEADKMAWVTNEAGEKYWIVYHNATSVSDIKKGSAFEA